MPLYTKVDGGSNYKCFDFEDRERILERITMNITFEPHGRVQNENRKIFMISLGYVMYVCHVYIYVQYLNDHSIVSCTVVLVLLYIYMY